MSKDTGPEAATKGAVEGVKGKAKEAVGAATGREGLRREGRAQQEKAESQRDVAAKEAEAEKARAEVAAHEADQRGHQKLSILRFFSLMAAPEGPSVVAEHGANPTPPPCVSHGPPATASHQPAGRAWHPDEAGDSGPGAQSFEKVIGGVLDPTTSR